MFTILGKHMQVFNPYWASVVDYGVMFPREAWSSLRWIIIVDDAVDAVKDGRDRNIVGNRFVAGMCRLRRRSPSETYLRLFRSYCLDIKIFTWLIRFLTLPYPGNYLPRIDHARVSLPLKHGLRIFTPGEARPCGRTIKLRRIYFGKQWDFVIFIYNRH